MTEVEWDVFIKGDEIEVMESIKGPRGRAKPPTRRMKKAQKQNVYVCDCGAGLETKSPRFVRRHEETQKHLDRILSQNRVVPLSSEARDQEPVPEEYGDLSVAIAQVVPLPKVPRIKKGRKDLFYCRQCGKQRRLDPVTGNDFLGHPGPTGEVKVEVLPLTVVEVVEKTGLSTNSSDVFTSLNKLEHEIRERIRSSEKILSHIDAMRKVLNE